MGSKNKKGKIGSSFKEFLIEKNLHAEASSYAIKRVIAWQIEKEMQTQGLTKSRMAERMNTSRSQLDRLLDPANDNISLETVQRAATALGRELSITFKKARA